jgi:hypothetical protein
MVAEMVAPFFFFWVQINQKSIAKNENTEPHPWNTQGAGKEPRMVAPSCGTTVHVFRCYATNRPNKVFLTSPGWGSFWVLSGSFSLELYPDTTAAPPPEASSLQDALSL